MHRLGHTKAAISPRGSGPAVERGDSSISLSLSPDEAEASASGRPTAGKKDVAIRPPMIVTTMQQVESDKSNMNQRHPPFWKRLSIEIDPAYKGDSPKWAEPVGMSGDSTELVTIPSMSQAGWATDSRSREAALFARGTATIMIVASLAQLVSQLMMFGQTRRTQTWWAGLYGVLVGLLGLVNADTAATYFRALTVLGILVGSIAAVLEEQTHRAVHAATLCGRPDVHVTDNMNIGEWCSITSGCACLVNAAEPGTSSSCQTFRTALGGDHACSRTAKIYEGYLEIGVVLAWGLAATCLVAFASRLGLGWYSRRVKRFRAKDEDHSPCTVEERESTIGVLQLLPS